CSQCASSQLLHCVPILTCPLCHPPPSSSPPSPPPTFFSLSLHDALPISRYFFVSSSCLPMRAVVFIILEYRESLKPRISLTFRIASSASLCSSGLAIFQTNSSLV